MSTIASPRQSLTLSGRRDSISTDNSARSASTSRAAPTGSLRRNRNALRDYYGLKAAPKEAEQEKPPSAVVEQEHEIDREGFDAAAYVSNLLATESLESVLRAEASLVSETKTLDGEKKALIYDNYSKLIAATQTIRKMRTNMDPLGPTTSTLTPAIAHIAKTATELSELLKRQHSFAEGSDGDKVEVPQKQLVQWVLAAPERLRYMMSNGNRSAAEKEWTRIETILNKWQDVSGVEDVRRDCMTALQSSKEKG